MVKKFEDLTFENNDIGMSVPNNVSIHVSDTVFRGNKIGFQMFDVKSAQDRLGLPIDTPNEVLLDALTQLRDRATNEDLNPKEFLKESKLWTYIQRAKDSAEVVQKIVEIYQGPTISAMIASISYAMSQI